MLIVTAPTSSSGLAQTARRRRSAAATARSLPTPASSSANSSPPRRAAVSLSRESSASAADEHDGYGVLRVGEHPREFGGADPLQLLVGDDDVGARALQRDERLRAARHARDDEAALFKRLSVGADGGVVGHEQNAALVARRRATTVFRSSCCAHVQTSGCLYPAD